MRKKNLSGGCRIFLRWGPRILVFPGLAPVGNDVVVLANQARSAFPYSGIQPEGFPFLSNQSSYYVPCFTSVNSLTPYLIPSSFSVLVTICSIGLTGHNPFEKECQSIADSSFDVLLPLILKEVQCKPYLPIPFISSALTDIRQLCASGGP
mgnify:CR=1 FL=1